MAYSEILNEIRVRCPQGILETQLRHGNELIVRLKPESIPELAFWMSGSMGQRLTSLFCTDERELEAKGFVLRYVFSDDVQGTFTVLEAALPPGVEEFPSVTRTVYAASQYEREIQDLYGLTAIGHPNPKPLVLHGNWPMGIHPMRRDTDGSQRPPFETREPEFERVDGEGVFEIPVGPVHAGIIEPGHFRFSVAGEPIINLEAQLYFVHRGIEKLCEGKRLMTGCFFAERISGDESFSNSLAYCQAVERIAGVEVPPRAALSRVVFAEQERLLSHLGDLAGICNDVAYGFAYSQFRMLRTWTFLLSDVLCGVRLLRNVNKPGGLRADTLKKDSPEALELLDRIEKELQDTMEIVLHNAQFLDRVENTGILQLQVARDLSVTGPGARATGLVYDVRKAFPYAAYPKLSFEMAVHHDGGVNGRMRVKMQEALTAISLMRQALQQLPEGPVSVPLGPLPAYASALSSVEAPRGESVHYVMTGPGDTLYRYKVRTASYCNWQGFVTAVNGNVVPDFPLINKSFNLSYAGNDL